MKTTDPSFTLEPNGALTVRGTTITLLPYVVEITDRDKAHLWARALAGVRYHRLCVGNKPIGLVDRG